MSKDLETNRAEGLGQEISTGETGAPGAEGMMPQGAPETQSAGPKRVPYRAKLDSQHTEDIFVSVNGERYQIQRGVEVMIPDYIAEVLQHSVAQDEAALRERMRQEDQYLKKSGA